MFPCCKKAGGSIPRTGKPCVAFACSPSVRSSSFLPQTKDVDTKATGSSAVFVGVNVSCLSLHVDPAMSRWLTTPNKTKSVTQNGWNSVIVISIFCEKMRQPITATAWKERRKQNDVDRWDWQANCVRQQARWALVDRRDANERKTKQNSEGTKAKCCRRTGSLRYRLPWIPTWDQTVPATCENTETQNPPWKISNPSFSTRWLSISTFHISIRLFGGAQGPHDWKRSGTWEQGANSKEVPLGWPRENKKKGVKGGEESE